MEGIRKHWEEVAPSSENRKVKKNAPEMCIHGA